MNPYILVAIFAAGIAAGSAGMSWYEDSKRLAEREAIDATIKAFETRESGIAIAVETKLQELKANETIIERRYRQIIEKPVYRQVCIDDAGLDIINGLQLGNDGNTSNKTSVTAD